MAIYNVNDIVRIRAVGEVNGEGFENIVHFRIKTAITDIVQLRNEIVEQFLKAIRPFCTSQMRYLHINHKRVRPGPETTEEMVIIDPVVGTYSGDAMPHQMAVLIRHWGISDSGPIHGRIYVPGWPVEQFTSGLFTVAYRSTLLGQMNSILTRNGVGGTNTYTELGILYNQRAAPDSRFFQATDHVQYGLYPAVQRSRRPHIT